MYEEYKVLLVDDEAEVRTTMIKKINWKKLGFQVVGDAENGIDALEKLEFWDPDLIITDIRMPYMDGLQLAEYIYKVRPSTKVAIISGFDDFEYAKQAIKVNVMEYILKPVNAKEMSEILKKIRKTLDEEVKRIRDITSLQETFQKNLPILREYFLGNLIKGNLHKEEIPMLMEEYNLLPLMKGKSWVAVKVMLSAIPLSGTQKNRNLLYFSIKQLIEDRLKEYGNYVCFHLPSGLCIIVALEKDSQMQKLETFLNDVCRESRKFLKQPIVIGVGRAVQQIAEISKSYIEAREAASYSGTVGDVIFIDDMEIKTITPRLRLTEQDEKELEHILKFGDEEAIQSCVEMISVKMKEVKESETGCQTYIIDILSVILRVLQSGGLEEKIVFGEYRDYNGVLSGIRTEQQLYHWLCNVCFAVSGSLAKERMGTTQTIIIKAKQYIEENYANSALSLEMICGYLHISTAYFSTIFKREVGESYISYLTGIRMEKAACLLKNTDDKTYVIAAKVGYDEPNYFSYVFKKKFGVSPNKFRGK